MGGLYSKFHSPLKACGSVAEIITGRKRKHGDDSDASDDAYSAAEKSLNTPKRKKLLCTTQYIYQALFKEQQNADISVMALGKIWQLHKVYLCQSPYFASMFNGSWRETDSSFVNIEIIDPKIDINALEMVFGSLYLDEVTIDPKTVASVLATATLFQLDGLINRCAEVMTETVNAETSLDYYDAACEYGVDSVKNAAFKWLLTNLLSFYANDSKWLGQIDVDLMADLVESADLFVVQTEFSVYMLLRFWLFLKLHPNYETLEPKPENMKFFANQAEANGKTFLCTPQGQPYEKPFKYLRLRHLVNHPIDLSIILSDRLMPETWLNEPVFKQWYALLRIDQSPDSGPIDSDENYFLRDSLRCGRILKEAGLQKWRWTGFNFGLDLIIISDTKTLSIKRHHRADYERLLSMQVKRTFLIRVTVSSLNDQRQTKHVQTTGITLVSLDKNEEVPLITLESQLEYPLLIAVNLLMSTNSALLRTSFCAAGPQMDLATFLANQQSKSSINLNSSTST